MDFKDVCKPIFDGKKVTRAGVPGLFEYNNDFGYIVRIHDGNYYAFSIWDKLADDWETVQ